MRVLVMNRKYGGVFGGVELMSTSLVNEMTARGHECHILSLDQEGAVMCYDIDSNIKWHKIASTTADQKASWVERWKRFFKIRKILKEENIDIAIGFQDGAFLSLATAAIFLKTNVLAAERNAPSRFDFIKAGRFKHLTFNSFRMAKYVTVQCQSYLTQYPRYLRHKIKVIPNPVFPAVDSNNSVKKKKRIGGQILSVGRVSYQKNYNVLIKAFSLLSNEFQGWNLVIVGDGEDKETLETQVRELNLSDRVHLVGYDKNPQKYFPESDIFCLPSRWEGFPNALAEAMQFGIPCVGFAGCSGVSDLIHHENTGILADGNENIESLKLSLEYLMRDSDLRIKMGEAGKIKVKQYEPQKVFDMWESLFKGIKV